MYFSEANQGEPILIKAASRRVIGPAGRKDAYSAAGRSIVAALTEEPGIATRPPILSGGKLACKKFSTVTGDRRKIDVRQLAPLPSQAAGTDRTPSV